MKRRKDRAARNAAVGILLVVILVSGLLTACTPGGGGGKTLRFGCGEYAAVNPGLYEPKEIDALIFSGLTAHDENNKVVPDLAESWDFSATDNVYTFHLREDVKWHDGKPFAAEDVQFTLESIMDSTNDSEIASNFDDVAGVDVVDDHTVRIAMAAPNPAFLDYLTVGMLPAHLLRGKDLRSAPFNRKPVGTGPFQLQKWEEGKSITLKRNDAYYGSAAKLDQVVFEMVPDQEKRVELLKSGDLDLAKLAPENAAQFTSGSGISIHIFSASDYRGILYNFNNPLFAENPELPKALSYGVNRQEMVKQVLLGHGEAAYSPLQRSVFNNPSAKEDGYNPQKMAQLLEKAGWEKNEQGAYEKNGEPLSFEVQCEKEAPVQIALAQQYAEQLKKEGVSVTVKETEQLDWIGQAAWISSWGSPFDPDEQTFKVFASGQHQNRGNYADNKVDALLSEAREMEDAEQRAALYQEFQLVLAQNPPMTFLVYTDAVYAISDDVTGYQPKQTLGVDGIGILRNIAIWDKAE